MPPEPGATICLPLEDDFFASEEIGREEAGEIIAAFDSLPFEIRPSALLLPAAFELAVELDRTLYDSLYLALAVVEGRTLVTANAKFHATIAAALSPNTC